MDPAELTRLIRDSFEAVETVEANGDTFFFVGGEPADQRMPFATLVTSDFNDTASNLARPGVYRLNLGIDRPTYEARFGPPPPGPITAEAVDTGHDYTAFDVLMPHPIYASLAWVCVLNPAPATLDGLQPLLAEAYRIALDRRERRLAR